MRGDQLARQWRVIRAIEASPGGLTVAEIAGREETGPRTLPGPELSRKDAKSAKQPDFSTTIFKISHPEPESRYSFFPEILLLAIFAPLREQV